MNNKIRPDPAAVKAHMHWV